MNTQTHRKMNLSWRWKTKWWMVLKWVVLRKVTDGHFKKINLTGSNTTPITRAEFNSKNHFSEHLSHLITQNQTKETKKIINKFTHSVIINHAMANASSTRNNKYGKPLLVFWKKWVVYHYFRSHIIIVVILFIVVIFVCKYYILCLLNWRTLTPTNYPFWLITQPDASVWSGSAPNILMCYSLGGFNEHCRTSFCTCWTSATWN